MADTWTSLLRGDSLSWLLERDDDHPGVRCFALTDVLGAEPDAPEVVDARAAAMASGPVPTILAAQHRDGYWVEPGVGYTPKYRSTCWQITFLAQLGADRADERVAGGCEYVLEHARADYGGFSYNGRNSGLIQCLEGNLCAALLDFGFSGDQRLDSAIDWLARSVTGAGIAAPERRKSHPVHYYRSGNSGPGFACSANGHLGCAWGAVKAMLALSRVPDGRRSEAVSAAIAAGLDFLLSRDPATADYPMATATKPSGSWFKFGFPLGYVTDVLQNLEVLVALGHGDDPRLARGIELVLSKQDEHGRWPLEYTYNGKTWVDIERKGAPSKWVTLRALRVLRHVEGELLSAANA
ncbi:MAG: nitrogen fixation protein NifH [Anaerolineae bacterium]